MPPEVWTLADDADLVLHAGDVVQGRLDEAEALVAPSGGTVLEPKHAIGPHGFRTIIRDTEGNRMALHSM